MACSRIVCATIWPAMFRSLRPRLQTSLATGSRSLTTTPLHALFALNHPLIHDAASAIAKRTAATPNPAQRIAATCRIIFQRQPDESEQSRATDFLEKYQSTAAPSAVSLPEEAWPALIRSLLATNELLFLD